MSLQSIPFRRTILSGAGHGALVWSVYAITESLFSALLPWIINPTYVYTTPHWAFTPAHWGFTAILFILYPVTGSILGGLFSTLFRIFAVKILSLQKAPAAIIFSAIAKITIIVLFSVNLVVYSFIENRALIILVILFVSLPLATILILTAFSQIKFERFKLITNPWVICLALIGPLWIARELLQGHSMVIKALSILAYFVLIAFALFLMQKVKVAKNNDSPEREMSAYSVRSLAILLSAAILILCFSVVLKQKPLFPRQNVKPFPDSVDSPNIILIVMDTVRADHLSVYGYDQDTTPYLRNFADNATLYTQAIAPSNMTLSTHASIFTGLYSRKHGAHFAFPHYPTGRPLQDKYYTMAEMLSEKGYFTSGVIGNVIYLTLYHGLNQGFQYLDARNRIPLLGQTQPYYLKQVIRNIFLNVFPLSTFELKWRRAEHLNNGAFDILQKVKEGNKPFFLFLNYMDAHWPYLPPSPFDSRYPGKVRRLTTENFRKIKDEVMNFERDISEMESRHLISQYDGGIAYIDFHIWKLIERLKELGLYENTLLIITSDHGEVFGERNIVEHSFTVYQDEVHVPLIIKYPNNNQGHIVDDVVSLVDLMPTIFELLGDEIPEELQGNSLLKIETGNPGTVLSESFIGDFTVKHYGRRFQPEWAIFSGSSKFIRSAAGKREFYDLSKDPNETRNLFNKDHNDSEKLEKSLNEWLKTVKEESGPPVDYDRKRIERLKTLGYVE